MIEKYFLKGVRYKWVAPGEVKGGKDGKIVDNTDTNSRMVYDGLDGKLLPDASLGNITTYGFTKGMSISHLWLDYSPGRTSICPLSGKDVLTGFMSGCYIALWTFGSATRVAHVGTEVGSDIVNKKVKEVFARAIAEDRNACGFNPALAWDFSEINTRCSVFQETPAAKIIALVTTSGKFYSILMLQLKESGLFTGDWCVGGIKEIPAIRQNQLIEKLNK